VPLLERGFQIRGPSRIGHTTCRAQLTISSETNRLTGHGLRRSHILTKTDAIIVCNPRYN
jgi:hypothetical protein